MKAFIKIVYGLCIITMFVIFGFFLDIRFEQYQAGGYASAPIEREQCEYVQGTVLIVNGQQRCYTDAENYLTGKDFGNDVKGGADSFEDCVVLEGEILVIEGEERCYVSEKKFFRKQSVKPDQLPEEEPVPEKITVQDFNTCRDAGGEIVKMPFNQRCYMSDSEFFAEKTEKEVLSRIVTYADCILYEGTIIVVGDIERCYVSDTKFFEKTAPSGVSEKPVRSRPKPSLIIPDKQEEIKAPLVPDEESVTSSPIKITNYQECVQQGGDITEIPFNKRCYITDSEFFTEKTESQVLAQIKTYQDCVTYGGTIEAVPFNKYCYVTDKKSFPEKTESEVFAQIKTYKDCLKYGGKIEKIPFNTRCYLSDTKFFAEKNESEVIAQIKTYQDCLAYGGKVIDIPLNKRCYVTDEKFFDQRSEQEILNAITNFVDCKVFGGEVHGDRCYLSETKFFIK